ncbi:LAME_0A00936g1_1 [Lachancea meyersii CBS 8951]|uniref:Mitochondrial inner membrane protease subunit n=1 Tax=Lachancea meyersii CBS 8951 TaxID=1266667 RepID=A0A1G4ILJ1_9SACH|nr:LAME_0A00936g1_1 [Lachancea meyersii CBS 8951]
MKGTVGLWLRTGSLALRSFCLVHVINSHFYEFTETRGESMLPTLAAINDYVHASKKYRNGKDCQIGDCIVAVKPTDPYQRVCKRITGMPGDYILIDPSAKEGDDIDGQAFNSYIRVPMGHVWVTGDNLSQSLDSRTYNSLPMGLIKGKIIAANDFNKPIWHDGALFGFRSIENSYSDEF